MKNMKRIAASKFKAECLHILDMVKEKKESFIITKHNRPIAQLIPVEEEKPIYGYLKDVTHIIGDIMSPIKEEWDVLR